MKRALIIILLMLIPFLGYSQISTDRPSVSDAVTLIEAEHIQIETGYSTKDYLSVAFRGGLTDWLEVRFVTTDNLEKSYGNAGARIKITNKSSVLIEKDVFDSNNFFTVKYLRDFTLGNSNTLTFNANYTLNDGYNYPHMTLCYTKGYALGGFLIEVYNTNMKEFSPNSGVLGGVYYSLLPNVQVDLSASYSDINEDEYQIGLSIKI